MHNARGMICVHIHGPCLAIGPSLLYWMSSYLNVYLYVCLVLLSCYIYTSKRIPSRYGLPLLLWNFAKGVGARFFWINVLGLIWVDIQSTSILNYVVLLKSCIVW
jgi:hypothetical protein